MSFDSEDGPRTVKQMKLVRDVSNPRADRRKRELFSQSLIPAGTKISVTTYDRTYTYTEKDGTEIKKVETIIEVNVHPDSVKHWSDRHGYPRPELRDLLLQNAEEMADTIKDWMRNNKVIGRSGWSEEILENLILKGKITKEEVLVTMWEAQEAADKAP